MLRPSALFCSSRSIADVYYLNLSGSDRAMIAAVPLAKANGKAQERRPHIVSSAAMIDRLDAGS